MKDELNTLVIIVLLTVANKVAAIKRIIEVFPRLGLKAAKELVENSIAGHRVAINPEFFAKLQIGGPCHGLMLTLGSEPRFANFGDRLFTQRAPAIVAESANSRFTIRAKHYELRLTLDGRDVILESRRMEAVPSR